MQLDLFQWINLLVAGCILVVAYVDKKKGLRDRLKSYALRQGIRTLTIPKLGSLDLEVTGRYAAPGWFYYVFSYFFTVAFVLVMYLFTTFRGNILTLRALNDIVILKGGPGNFFTDVRGAGHWLIWLAIFMVYARYGFADIFRAVYVTGFFVALHELGWYAAWFFVEPSGLAYVSQYIAFVVLCIALVIAYGINMKEAIPKKKLAVILGGMAFYYVLWVAANFPITVDNITGPTAFYGSLQTNFMEDMSWDFLAFLFL